MQTFGRSRLGWETAEHRLEELNARAEDPSLWNDPAHAQKVTLKLGVRTPDVAEEDAPAIEYRSLAGDYFGALGIPVRGLKGLTRGKHQFHDTELSGTVKNAVHALAIRAEPPAA